MVRRKSALRHLQQRHTYIYVSKKSTWCARGAQVVVAMLLPLSQPGPVAAAAALVVEDIIRRCGTEFEVRAGPDARSQKWLALPNTEQNLHLSVPALALAMHNKSNRCARESVYDYGRCRRDCAKAA